MNRFGQLMIKQKLVKELLANGNGRTEQQQLTRWMCREVARSHVEQCDVSPGTAEKA